MQKQNFLNYHGRFDQYYDFVVKKDLWNFTENVLFYNDTKGSLPWYASKGCYTFLSLFMLSWI